MTTENFYKQKRWIQKRKKILRRDQYVCQESNRYGKSKLATHVHHIIPLEWCLEHKPEWAYATQNLISLAEDVHNEMHDRTNNLLTQKGKDLIIRRFGDLGREWLKKYG